MVNNRYHGTRLSPDLQSTILSTLKPAHAHTVKLVALTEHPIGKQTDGHHDDNLLETQGIWVMKIWT